MAIGDHSSYKGESTDLQDVKSTKDPGIGEHNKVQYISVACLQGGRRPPSYEIQQKQYGDMTVTD